MIHATAVVDPAAVLGEVTVGPFAVIGPRVRLHDGVVVGAHAVITGDTEVGPRSVVHPHVVLGGPPQDKKHDLSGESRLRIGEDNVFREFFTANGGSSHGAVQTTIGDRNYFMANSHVAHDCVVGSDVMFANSAAIAGHVTIGDGAVLGGLCAVHQNARVGRLAMVGGGAMCAQDVPPFTLAQGDRARLFGVNIIGLRRHRMGDDAVSTLKDAFRMLFVSDLPRRTAISRVDEQWGSVPEVAELLSFLGSSVRGVCRAGLELPGT